MAPLNDDPPNAGGGDTINAQDAKQGKRGTRTFQIFLASTVAAAVALFLAFLIASVAP